MTPEAVAGTTGWPLDFITKGLAELVAPDKRSRTPDHDGRRLLLLDEHREWGWSITNYAKYRDQMRSAERREYLSDAKRRERAAKKSTAVNMSTTVNHGQPITETETETETDQETGPAPAQASSSPARPAPHSGSPDQDSAPIGAVAGDPAHRGTAIAKPERKKPKRQATESITGPTWQAYSIAYQNRYGVPPTGNAKVNGQMSMFCQRVPLDEAPLIAAYYLRHNSAYYLRMGHAVGPMLADAEKLRTEWATDTRMTESTARQMDQTDGQGQMWKKLIEKNNRANALKEGDDG